MSVSLCFGEGTGRDGSLDASADIVIQRSSLRSCCNTYDDYFWMRFGRVIEPDRSKGGCSEDTKAECIGRLENREVV